MANAAKESPNERVWEEDLEVLPPAYGVDDVPPPTETLLYAWQHTLVDISPYVLPLVVAAAVGYTAEQGAYMISACLVLMGVFTFINATWGHGLPSVMGPSATNTSAMASAGALFGAPAMWMAAFVGGIFEAVVGATGVITALRRYLPAYVCGIVVVAIGASLARVAGGWVFSNTSSTMLSLSGATVISIIALTMIGHRFNLGILARGAIFFSLLFWGAGVGSLTGVVNLKSLNEAAWFGLPQFAIFGAPFLGWELVGGALIGVLIGYIGSIAESVGDYAGTCAVSGVTYTTRHIKRGLTVEGISAAVAPLFGAIPLTTYSQNTGVIATTRVASRRVIQVAAGLLTLYGLSPKFGALLMLIPRPIIGAVFLVICGMIATAGLRLLNSGKKDEAYLMTTAITLIAAITLPLSAPANAAWFGPLHPLAKLMLTNSIVIAITLGVTLNALLRAVLPTTEITEKTAA